MKNTLTTVFAVLAALLLAGCPNPMNDLAPAKNAETGMLSIELLGVNNERTLLPHTPVFSHYELSFTPQDGQAAHADVSTTDGLRSTISISGLAAGR